MDAVSGSGAFDIIMEIFSDRNFTQHFSGDPPEVLVPETVYVVASVSRDGVVLQVIAKRYLQVKVFFLVNFFDFLSFQICNLLG